MENEKLNYVLVGKRATIECLLLGEIESEEMENIQVIDIESQDITPLCECRMEDVFNAIEDPNTLFVQKSNSK